MKLFLSNIRNGRILIALSIIFFSNFLQAQQLPKGLTASNGQYIGFYEFKPYDYNSTSTKYPLIIFLHGVGERGNGTTELSRVLSNAIPRYCANGATMTFNYSGQSYSFLVLSPQLNSSYGTWENFYVEEMIKHAKQNLRVDTNRIYLCGLSLGGGGVWKFPTASAANARSLAAIAPVCATSEGSTYCHIAQQALPVWAFHALDDFTVHWTNTKYCLDQINACSPIVAPKVTYYPNGGHGIWDRAFDMGYTFQNPNVYEWFLSHSRSTLPPGNAPPVANAGADISFNLPTNSTTLTGSGSYDPNGIISTYAWSKISGPNQFTIDNPSGANTVLSNLVQGTYAFRLMVTDNAGLTDDDTVVVTVNGPVNQAPVANAGTNASITLPVNSTSLNGSASYDSDGTIAYYGWSKLSGPAQFSIQNPYGSVTTVNNLVQGTYSFLLVVTDNNGATGKDTVVINVVQGTPPPNQPPIANAGANMNITLPINSTTLNGSASSDADGTISGYTWSKISGPTSYTIANPTSVTTSLTGLVQGTYSFQLSVTDNNGAPGLDTVLVTVNAAPPPPNQPPIANAGANINITLPINSTTLNGSSSNDADGTISGYTWSKISGPTSYTIANPASVTTSLTGLVQGTYSFQLLVTDNNGATGLDTVLVTINAAPPPPNQPPIANAGANINITLPINSTALNGSASSDADGTISGYAWSKISGPTSYTIANPASVTTLLTGLVQGTYSFQLLITDNNGATGLDTVLVTVNAAPPPPNQPPIANAGADINITLPVNNTTLDGSSSSDADGTISSYTWSKISGPTSYAIANPASVTTSLTGLVQGSYSFRLTVTDNNGATGLDTVLVTVNAAPPPPNQPPIANAGADINITLPVNNTTLDGSSSSDADGTISGYAWSKISGPTSYAIANPASVTTSLTGLVQGTYSFQLSVTDNNGVADTDTVLVTVGSAPPPANQSPMANGGVDIIITLPANNTTLNGSASSDPDGYINSHAWTKISGPAAYNIANAANSITALTNLTQGVYSFRLVVIDNAGATDDDTIQVTVNAAPNQVPVANAGADISITLPLNNTTLNGSASSDPDGSLTNYAWTKISGPSTFNINNPASVSTSLTNLIQGVYSFRLDVTDNNGATDSDTVMVTVNSAPPPPNQLPIANAGANINITLPVNSTTLNGTTSVDPDGAIVNYAWSKISGPASFTIVNAGAAITSLNALAQGVYSFRLVVTDNAGATDDDTVQVTVNSAPNQLPVANAGADISITLPVNNTTLNGSASSDPDGSLTNYAWTKISGPSTFNISNPASVSTSLTNLIQGVYSFRLDVADNNGATDSDTVMVTVNSAPPPPNQLPISNAGVDITITLPVNNTTLNGSASSDPDGFISSYAWSKISGPASFTIANAANSITALSNLAQGTYWFRLVVTDNNGATSSDTMQVIVNAAPPPPNQLPVANAGADITITLPTNSTTLNGTASFDPDGSITNYSWTKISGPASFTIANPTGGTTALNNLVQGSYLFRLSVTDNSGAVDTDTMSVIVNAAPPPPNQPPVANAGADITVQLPTNNGVLDGSASYDLGGTIVSNVWLKLSGPSQYAIVNPYTAITVVNNLVQGIYMFELTVTDNNGAVDKDTVMVTVNAASPSNQIPFANGGADITITLPSNTGSLNGSGSFDPDGSIVNYSWTKVNGPSSYTIANPGAAVTQVTGLVQGVYTFKLIVTDNAGATASDSVSVFVVTPNNVSPISNAGKDTTINLPATSITLNGNASKDPDGVLLTYEWKQLSGPAGAEISSNKSGITAINNLQEGKYEFELKVTDIQGASATDNVKVTVVNNFRFSQFFRSYPNPATNTIHFTYIDDGRGKTIVSIFNEMGKIMVEQQYQKSQSLLAGKINITSLPPGLYYLQIVQSGNSKLVRPFVKQ